MVMVAVMTLVGVAVTGYAVWRFITALNKIKLRRKELE